MSKKTLGTAYTNPHQLAEVQSRIAVALPTALEHLQDRDIDIKGVLRHTGNGERLALAIAEAVCMLYNGHVSTIPHDVRYINIPVRDMSDVHWAALLSGYRISPEMRERLLPFNGVTIPDGTLRVGIVDGKHFHPAERTTRRIRMLALRKRLTELTIHQMLLLCQYATREVREALGFSQIVGMHEMIDGKLLVSSAGMLYVDEDVADDATWAPGCGFAFLKSFTPDA